MKSLLFAIPALLALGACTELTQPVACPDWIPPSAVVTVQDSVSGANVTPGANVVLRNDAFADSVVAPAQATSVGLGRGSTGTFTLTVRQGGYQTWTKAEVKVEAGTCGAETVEVLARLRPE